MRAPSSARTTTALAMLAAVLGAASRCAGTLDDPGRFADAGRGAARDDAGTRTGAASDAALSTEASVSCPDVPSEVFLPNCTSAGCHNAQNKEQGLDLQSPAVGARLFDVPSSEGAGFLIDPAAPARSVLYTKLTSDPPFGAQMPTKGPLDDATIACVLSWVTGEANATPAADGGVDAAQGDANDE